MTDLLAGIEAVVFDVGETLVDETRAWAEQARRVGVTPLTLAAALGALIAQDRDHRELWGLLDVAPPTEPSTIRSEDLYPDALPCLRGIAAGGRTVGIAGNQPGTLERELRTAGFTADFVVSSTVLQVEKPSHRFFSHVIDACSCDPERILYVGDRLDNDVLPARRAGMRTAFLRRGPWGLLHAERSEAALADLRLGDLRELQLAFEALER